MYVYQYETLRGARSAAASIGRVSRTPSMGFRMYYALRPPDLVTF